MKYTKEQHKKSRDKFMTGLVIAFLIIVCIALSSGCAVVKEAGNFAGAGFKLVGVACSETAKALTHAADSVNEAE